MKCFLRFLFVSLDVVYIGTLPINHLSVGKLFLTSRKNVLIEKPLAINLREVQELITAAQDNSVFLMEVTYGGFHYTLEVRISKFRADCIIRNDPNVLLYASMCV